MAGGNRPSTRLRYLGRVAGHVLRTAIGHLLKLNPPDFAAGGFFIDGEGNSRQTVHANAIMTTMKVTSLKHSARPKNCELRRRGKCLCAAPENGNSPLPLFGMDRRARASADRSNMDIVGEDQPMFGLPILVSAAGEHAHRPGLRRPKKEGPLEIVGN